MKKLIVFLAIAFVATAFGQRGTADKAQGLFVAFGVGPRLPVSNFANSTDLGSGFNVEISYTDTRYIPFFVFARVGFDQFPGSQQYYEITDYSNYSTNALPVNVGIRYYFPPLVENVVLFMPIVEISADYNYLQILHQYKPATGKSNYLEDTGKFGFTAGAGLSMFMLEVVADYNYYQSNQFLSVDLKVRLPLYINL